MASESSGRCLFPCPHDFRSPTSDPPGQVTFADAFEACLQRSGGRCGAVRRKCSRGSVSPVRSMISITFRPTPRRHLGRDVRRVEQEAAFVSCS